MPQNIPLETWAILGQWVLYGSSMAGAVLAIAKFVTYLRSKTSVAKLEKEVEKHRELLANDNLRLNALEKQGDTLEEEANDTREILRLLMKSTQELLKGQIYGDNVQGMTEASNDINEYLNKQI